MPEPIHQLLGKTSALPSVCFVGFRAKEEEEAMLEEEQEDEDGWRQGGRG